VGAATACKTKRASELAPARCAIYRAVFLAAYLPACGRSVVGLAGGLMGTKRVSLLPAAGALDALKMASNRNMKISDSMGHAPWLNDMAASCEPESLT
jgi:hypothetical protein